MGLLSSMQVCRHCTGLLTCRPLLLKGYKHQAVEPLSGPVASVLVAATASTARSCYAHFGSQVKPFLLMPTSSSSHCAPSPEAASAAGSRSPESSPGLFCSSCPSWEALEATDCSDWPEPDQREGALPSASENPVCSPSAISMCCWAIWDWACRAGAGGQAVGRGCSVTCEEQVAAPAGLWAFRQSLTRLATLMGGWYVGAICDQCSEVQAASPLAPSTGWLCQTDAHNEGYKQALAAQVGHNRA